MLGLPADRPGPRCERRPRSRLQKQGQPRLPTQLAPDLARSVPPSACIVDALDRREGLDVLFEPVGGLSGFAGGSGSRASGRRSGRQDAAGRLDSAGLAVLFDKRDHLRNERSSSARAKQADTFFRISLAVRNFLFSRSSSLIPALSALLRRRAPPGCAIGEA